jgi:mono/diheme cytochrome c family protein
VRAIALVSAVVLLVCSAPILLAARASGDVVRGRILYTRYCAACHGIAADGLGPVAPVLRQAPSDLRRLGERHGTPLPAERLARFVDGREAVAAHGPREMPIWGERLGSPEPEQSGRPPSVDERIRAIVAYLGTIQGSADVR